MARQVAHEIKNPLTPIQLAAERLQMKLADKLPPDQADVLVRGATTIVNQVAAMKRMVDDFRDYARVPPARLVPLDLKDIPEFNKQEDLDAYVVRLETEMREAAKKFEFEKAAKLRDTIRDLRTKEFLFT